MPKLHSNPFDREKKKKGKTDRMTSRKAEGKKNNYNPTKVPKDHRKKLIAIKKGTK